MENESVREVLKRILVETRFHWGIDDMDEYEMEARIISILEDSRM